MAWVCPGSALGEGRILQELRTSQENRHCMGEGRKEDLIAHDLPVYQENHGNEGYPNPHPVSHLTPIHGPAVLVHLGADLATSRKRVHDDSVGLEEFEMIPGKMKSTVVYFFRFTSLIILVLDSK
jgi:hypothetical protein